jgi:hypothetical protein
MTWDGRVAQAAWNAQRAQERELSALLAEWAEAEGIATGDVAAEVADRLAESPAMRSHAAVLIASGTAPQALRDAAAGAASIASVEPGEFAAEEHWHGHGEKPRKQTRRGSA